MNKTATIVLAGLLAMSTLTACGEEPKPAVSWAPGQIMPQFTVRSKQILGEDPSDPSKITCYEVVLEHRARTDRYCVTRRLWENAEPGKLMSWE